MIKRIDHFLMQFYVAVRIDYEKQLYLNLDLVHYLHFKSCPFHPLFPTRDLVYCAILQKP